MGYLFIGNTRPLPQPGDGFLNANRAEHHRHDIGNGVPSRLIWTDSGLRARPDRPVAIELAGRPILVGSSGETLWAIDDRCSHANCAFSTDGEIDGLTAICDCHGSEFDIRTGQALVPPATQPISVYRVRIDQERVEVYVP